MHLKTLHIPFYFLSQDSDQFEADSLIWDKATWSVLWVNFVKPSLIDTTAFHTKMKTISPYLKFFGEFHTILGLY